jgi:LDH2 family malate/lactate/ureidoglycolate dehydrogenase
LITPDLPLPAEADRNEPATMTSVPASVVLVIDPAQFGAGDEYREKIDRYAAAIKGVKRRPGADPIRMPGEAGIERLREYATLQVRAAHWDAFVYWCGEFGVDVDAEREAFRGHKSEI